MLKTGDTPGMGKYRCTRCGNVISVKYDDGTLPTCPKCHNTTFVREE